MGLKKRANKKPSAIVTPRTSLRMNADPGPLPPKSKKTKTNNSDSSKKRANVESAAIVTQSSTGKAKLPPYSDPLAVKKMTNVESSIRCEKGKVKLPPNSDPLSVSEKPNFKKRVNVESFSRREKGKAKEDDTHRSKKVKLIISEERVYVQPTSGVLTRWAKFKMDSDRHFHNHKNPFIFP